jgi:putative FmdB family regulatory protein
MWIETNMPIYEYVCPHCHKTFEEWLKVGGDDAERPCPECGRAAPRVLSPTTFILKGGGWYVTEYGSHRGTDKEGAAPSGGNADGKGSRAEKETAPAPAVAAKEQKAAPEKGNVSAGKAVPPGPAPVAGGNAASAGASAGAAG